MAESYVTTLISLNEEKILADLNAIAIEKGLITNVFETSRIYIYYAVFARVLGNVTRSIAEYISNMDIETTTDEALLDQLIKPFVKKRNAKVAKVILKFTRREDALNITDVFIPRDFEVMTEGNDPIIFRTAESRVFWKDAYEVLIPAYSVEFGSLNNLSANKLTYFNDAMYSDIEVTNPDPAYGGADEETAFDTRNRIDSFRYARDGSISYLQQLIFDNNVSYYGYNIIEYWDGFGSVLIALDVMSDDEYYDIVQSIESMKRDGVKYHYCQVGYIYIDVTVTVKITGDKMGTEYTQNEIETNIKTAMELYFNSNIHVGKKLSQNRLEAYLLQYLVDERYDIYETEIEIAPSKEYKTNPTTGQIEVEPWQRLYPSRLTTNIEYTAE